MSKSAPRPPPPPDPRELVQAQIDVLPTQITPLGRQDIGTIGPGGQFIPNTDGQLATQVTLPGDAQAALDFQLATARTLGGRAVDQAGGLPSDPVSFEGLPEFGSGLDFGALPATPSLDLSSLTDIPGIDDFSADAGRVRDATFQRALGLLNPEFERTEDRLRQTLANQGLPIGGEAFEGEFDRFDRTRNEALNAAAFNAIGAGSAEQSRLFGLASAARGQGFGEQLAGTDLGFRTRQQALSEGLQGIDLSRTARQQGISELTGLRGSQFNELASLLGLGQLQLPQFNAPTPIDTLTPAAMQQSGQLAAFNAANQQQQALMSGLFGLGSAGITGAGLAGGFGPLLGLAAGCWVAREVYGEHNPKWLVFREWMFTRAPRWLLYLYLKHGERLALWLRGKDWLKTIIRRWMDARLRGQQLFIAARA